MTISFSGLASGLDTSSWVESLVALKQAKINTLEEEKETVLLSKETLNNIKSFFNSFRSVIEKVTDAKFGIPTMDLFAQNLAISANLDVLTATATTEAEQATYNVLVDQLATNTTANSNYSYMTTIIQTTTATIDSKLIHLGVKAGNIGVTVGGIERNIDITENDTIGSFIDKLKEIGVEASYNDKTGVFSVDLDKNAINDIGNTGIVNALHLDGVNEGYTSDELKITHTDTVYSAATRATLMSELGAKNGVMVVNANDANYNITITSTSTLGSFIDDLKKCNINATLDETGILTIEDANITSEGTTDIKNALGLDLDVYSNTQKSTDLSHKSIITQTTNATSSTLLKDLGEGINITGNQTVILKNSNNTYATVTVNNTTTVGDLLAKISNAGLYAALNEDGMVEITGGTITGGTFDAISALKLSVEPYTAMTTGKPLTETIETFELVTLETKLVDDLKVRAGYIEVTDADGNKFYEKIYHGQTLADFMSDMGNLGIYTKLRDDGVLEITGGAFATLSDDRVKELIANGTIRETDDRYKQGTDLLTCLYGAPVISTDQISVASTYSKSKALTHSVIHTINAELTTTLGTLGLSGNGTAIFNVRGENRTINITKNTTVEGLMNTLKNAGIASSWDSDTHRLTIENATLTGGSSNLGTVLDLTATVSGKYVSSDSLSRLDTITIDATRDTLLSEFGITGSLNVNIYNSSGTLKGTMAVNGSTTIGSLIDYMGARGINATIKDGVLVINDGYITNSTLETALGLERSNKSSYALGSIMTVTTTAEVTGATTLGEIISTLGTGNQVSSGYTLLFNSQSLNVSSTTTLDDLIKQVFNKGGSAYIDATGRLTVKGGTLSGTVANALGITSVTTTNAVSATGNILYTTKEVYADLDTTLKNLGINTNTSLVIHNSLGNALKTINIANTSTIKDVFASLKTEGIDGIIANGVIELTSAENKYVTGALANSLGITTQTVTEVVNTTSHSTAAVAYTGTITASLETTLGQIGASGSALVYDKDGNCYGTISTLTTSSTIQNLFDALKYYGFEGSIKDGVISIYSGEGCYVNGALMTSLGISVKDGVNTTVTVAKEMTSSQAITYTNSFDADLNTKLSQIGINKNNTIQVRHSDGSTNNVIINSTDTIDQWFGKMNQYGISGVISDGVITLTSDNGAWVQDASGSNLLSTLGIGSSTSTTTKTVTVGTTATSNGLTHTVRQTATLTDKISSFVTITNGSVNVMNNGASIGTANVDNNTTFEQWFRALDDRGIQATMEDGVITITSNNGYYLSGAFLSTLGITAITTTTTVQETHTTGTNTSSSSAITYSEVCNANFDTTLGQLSITSGTYTIYNQNGTAVTSATKYSSATLREIFREWENYGIKADIQDGRITISNDTGFYVGGGLATSLGLSDSYVTVGESWTVTNISTSTSVIGGTITGSALTYTITRAMTLDDAFNFGQVELTDGKNKTNVTLNGSLKDIFKTLSEWGISCTLTDDGYLSISNSGPFYIDAQNGSANTKTFCTTLGISNSAKTTTYTVTTTQVYTVGQMYTTDKILMQTVTVAATEDTTFAELGINSPFDVVYTNKVTGGKSTVSMTTTSKLGTLMATMYSMMFGVSYSISNDGRLLINCDGDYVVDCSALGIQSEIHTVDKTITVTSTGSTVITLTTTVAATKTNLELLAPPKITEMIGDISSSDGSTLAGNYVIRNDDDNNCNYTINISDTDTISSMIRKLNRNQAGVVFSYDETSGTFTVIGNYENNTYWSLTQSSAAKLGISTKMLNKMSGNCNNVYAGSTTYRPWFKTYTTTELVTKTITESFTVDMETTGTITVPLTSGYSTCSHIFTYNDTALATSATLWKDVGITGCESIKLANGSTVYANSIQTIGDTLDQLAANDIHAYVDIDGYIRIDESVGNWIVSSTGALSSIFGAQSTSTKTIAAGTTITENVRYNSSDYKHLTKNEAKNISYDTKLSNISSATSSSITVNYNGQSHTLGFKNTEATYGDVFAALAAYGIEGKIQDGKITFIGKENAYITAMSNIGVSLTMPTTTVTTSKTIVSTGTATENRHFNISDLAKHQYNKTSTLNYDTTLGQLAITSNQNITVNRDGTSHTITMHSNDTMNDMLTALAGYGIAGYIDGGKLYLRGSENSYISNMDNTLKSKLNLTCGSGYTYTSTTITTVTTKGFNSLSNTLAHNVTFSATSDTTMAAIGKQGTITVNYEGVNYNVTASGSKTIGDVLAELAGYGISGSIVNGTVKLTGTSDGYITNAGSAFGITGSYYSTSVITTYSGYNTNSNEQHYTSTLTMTTSSTFSDLGINANQTVTVNSDGTSHVVTVNAGHTIDDLLTTLAGYGITGSIIDGKIHLSGSEGHFITGVSSGLSTALKITAGLNSSYTVVTTPTKFNSDSKDLNYTTNNIVLTEDTKLSAINGFANGNGNLVIHQTNGKFVTIKVNGSSTLSEFFTQISEYGLVGSVDSSGHVSIEGISNVYMQAASGGSNILTALKLSNVVSNVQTVTVNRTSNILTHTIKVAASGLTQIQNLANAAGATMGAGNGTIVLSTTSNAGNQLVTLTFARTSSVYDVINKLAEYGLQASIDANGKFSVSSSTLTDFSISGNLGNLLMGSYNKVYNKGDTINTSTHLLQTTVNPMTRETALSTFGITNGNIKITQQGVEYIVNINTANIKTVGEFMNLLSEYGFDSDIDSSGRLSISGIGESYLSNVTGGSNILDKFGITNWTLGEITQTSDHLTDHETIVIKPTMETKLSELTNSAGTSLGITSGNIYVYQDGTRYLVNINNNDTLQTLSAKLAQYGITMNLANDGKIYFDGTNDSYMTTQGLTSGASNILQKINIADNWSTRYDSTSQNLKYTITTNDRISGDTKLSELQDGSGNNLGITGGEVYVYNHGVRTTETINTDMTVNDLMATLARNGLIADIAEDGSISIGAHHNSYLATSATAGANSNLVSTLFSQWDFVNIYTSNNLEIPKDVIVAVNRDTKLKDINEGTYKEGIITVVKDGIQTNITLTSDDTIGTLMDTLGLYGFESVINENGQLILKNTGNSLLQKYTGTNASNALDLLGIDLNSWIQTNTYKGKPLNVIKTSTIDAAATRDTELSLLGVTTGEYFIYNNGVKYTAYISTGETLGSFIDTLKSFGIEASVVTNGNKSVLTITSLGDSYITKSTSTTDSSNVVEKLFGNTNHDSSYKYTGLEQTSEIVTTYSSATEETLLSYYNKPWGAGVLKAEGTLSVNVNGENAKIEITADETFGSLMDKFRALGLEATLASDGQLMIQSGYDTFTINTDGTTSNLLATIGLTYKKDLGGFAASSDTTKATTTLIEERTFSVANYADMNTKMGLLNISDGTLSVYKNGQKATIQVKKDETFGQLRSRISTAFADVDIAFEDGYLKFYSKTDGNSIEVGATTDTSNISAICGLTSDGSGTVRSARELFCVNSDTIITNTGLFRKGDVTEGTFTVGDATFNITDTTRMADIIAQINSNDAANATAYWDSIDGKLVIKSRTTGSALINIEAGTSNFTDVMGFTNTERKADGTVNTTKMNINTQDVGKNAKFSINGTSYTSNSNNITSDISRIKGLTINLKGLTDGSAVTITVERDKETLANAVSEIVDAYNELIENVDKAIAKDGQLHNQSVLKIIRNQLRNLMTSSDAGATVFKNLDAIGICTETAKANNISTAGITTLVFDKDKFINAYGADEDALKALLIGSENNTGVFTKIETLVESSLKSVTGYFDTTDNSYQKEITKIDNKIERQKKALERYRTQLEAKFASMDILIANMQQQYSSFLKT